MRTHGSWAVALALALNLSGAEAWDYYQFDLPSQAPEFQWRDALSAKLGARHEVTVEGGRVDVLSDTEAIEIDWPHKWHEGLGQALHYADMTGKQPVLALISYSQGPENLKEKSRQRFDFVEKVCEKRGVRLLVLFPAQPWKYGEQMAAAAETKPPSTNYWLNLETGVRHRPGCRFYEGTLKGRPCGADEGKPCKFCAHEP